MSVVGKVQLPDFAMGASLRSVLVAAVTQPGREPFLLPVVDAQRYKDIGMLVEQDHYPGPRYDGGYSWFWLSEGGRMVVESWVEGAVP